MPRNAFVRSTRVVYVAIIYGSSDSERRLLDKMPREVSSMDDMRRVRADFADRHRKASGWFAGLKRWNYRRQMRKIDRGMRDPLRVGAIGEKGVVDRLSVLDDAYHVFCDLRVRLPYTVRYNGQKNLRSAQMDLVVACPKGVFLIEVKNWSDRYAMNPGWSPHEQTERAGRVLWIALQGFVRGVRVTNVLLSIKSNIRHDPDYRSVWVSDPDRIVDFLTNKPDALPEDNLVTIVEALKRL